MNKNYKGLFLLLVCSMVIAVGAETLESGFENPPKEFRPETWFHLIGGNVSQPGLTADLNAVAGAGIGGIQLFHGSGKAWPKVEPQITCLSPSWDNMIGHVADETQRLGLIFTMQNCPGWAMSGGPWITPDKAMRHLIWSRRDVEGGRDVSVSLAKPQPSKEDWRDYQDVAVLAFPTPADDTDEMLIPSQVRSNHPQLPWMNLLRGVKDTKISIQPASEPVWVEVIFSRPVYLRSIELPPVEHLMARRNFDPNTVIHLQAVTDKGLVDVMSRRICRGTWQDREPQIMLTLAFSDYKASEFRITFHNNNTIELDKMNLSSAARVNDWRGQAGYALRSLERDTAPVQDPAAWIRSDSIVDVSDSMDADGKLTWKAPAGKWTVVRFGHVNTGAKNKPAPPEATGFECDKLSPAGAEQHFAGYIGRLTAPGGPAQGRLDGMLIDSWECFTQTWTPAMEKEFSTRRGYALRSWLPALAGWVIEDHLTSERFLRDWRATVSDLLVDNYFGRLTELAKGRSLKLSFETAIGDVSPGDILQYYSKADYPMCEFWQPADPHNGGLETKPIAPAASAAHIYGKQRLAAEAFTSHPLNWNEHPFMLKHMADFYFTLGVNHLVFHTYTHNPRLDAAPGTSFGSQIGTPFLRGQTWWKYMPLFTDYLSRCQFILEQGQPAADVLWYLGDDIDHKPRQDSPFPAGYKFDYLNFDALVNRVQVADGMLQIPEGTRWKVLWLSEAQCGRMTPQSLGRIAELLNDGATVVGSAPKLNASLIGGKQADKQFASFVRQLWGENPPAQGDRRIGKGRLLWGESLDAALTKLGIVPDVQGTNAATWCHRRAADMDIYFVAADRVSPLQANILFHAKGQPEFWEPLTGKRKPVCVYQVQGEHTAIPLDLPAAGSVFVVFRKGQTSSYFTKITHQDLPLMDAGDLTKVEQGKIELTFGFTRREELQPWVDNPFAAGQFLEDGRKFVAWQDGAYQFAHPDGKMISISVKGTQIIDCNASWTLSFPSGWGVPDKVELPKLLAWSDLKEPAASAFSGTATYSFTLNLERLDANSRLLLDLGRVDHIAEVIVGGKPAAVLWTAPFRADITSFVKAGQNRVDVKVTNTWYNRLAYDASLSEAERKTWSIGGPDAKSPVKTAGLTGPVRLHIGKAVSLSK